MACFESRQDSIPQIDSSIDLTSYLDDINSQIECCDDERLRVFIQSLEAAINPVNEQVDDCFVFDNQEEMYSSPDPSYTPENHDLDFSWMDVEMLSPSSSSSFSCSSSSDDISWYAQVSGDELDMSYVIEYGDVSRDYSEIPVKMEHVYSSLWQENYDLQGFESCRFQS